MEFIGSSFRDPSGYVFIDNGIFYRAVSPSYKIHYDLLLSSGLYKSLSEADYLIPFNEVFDNSIQLKDFYKIIKPVQVRTISYPYEWTFSQLKDVALALLAIQKHSLEHEMMLKDATPFNFQFYRGKPVLIDTLSFKKYPGFGPWVAYRQFCETILAPLALAAYCDSSLLRTTRVFLDGLPLRIIPKQLPLRAWFNPGIVLHIILHAKYQNAYRQEKDNQGSKTRFTKKSMLGLIHSLVKTVTKLQMNMPKSVWSQYYQSYVDQEYIQSKTTIIQELIARIQPELAWDLGANTGEFSRLVSKQGIPVMSFDQDYLCVELNYRRVKEENDRNILPLCMDAMNPSPACGWDLQEKMSWIGRGQPDLVMALALIHHLALGHNVSLDRIARFFSRTAPNILMEFVPKEDPHAQSLLVDKGDLGLNYSQVEFERIFSQLFELRQKRAIKNSNRILYWLVKR